MALNRASLMAANLSRALAVPKESVIPTATQQNRPMGSRNSKPQGIVTYILCLLHEIQEPKHDKSEFVV